MNASSAILALPLSTWARRSSSRQKRVRPAPMGRAYRYQRRSAHIVIQLAEKGVTEK